MRSTAEKRADASGLSRIVLTDLKTRRYIGRQAPVKRCLARFAGFAPRGVAPQLRRRAKDCAENQRKNLAIRKHLPDGGDVPRADQGQFLELAHTAGALGACEMAFAGMRAHDFSACGDFETLGGAAMGFQFLFWLLRISWHYKNPLRLACGLTAYRILTGYILLEWGAACCAPTKGIFRPVARLAANLVLPLEHPFWGPAARPRRCLPCAAWFQSGRVRRFRPASASSWRGPLPGAPFRGRDEKSSHALYGLLPGSE